MIFNDLMNRARNSIAKRKHYNRLVAEIDSFSSRCPLTRIAKSNCQEQFGAIRPLPNERGAIHADTFSSPTRGEGGRVAAG